MSGILQNVRISVRPSSVGRGARVTVAFTGLDGPVEWVKVMKQVNVAGYVESLELAAPLNLGKLYRLYHSVL